MILFKNADHRAGQARSGRTPWPHGYCSLRQVGRNFRLKLGCLCPERCFPRLAFHFTPPERLGLGGADVNMLCLLESPFFPLHAKKEIVVLYKEIVEGTIFDGWI